MFDAYTINATTLIVFPLIVAALVLILPMPREGLALVASPSQVLPFYWLVTRSSPTCRPTARSGSRPTRPG